MIAIASRWCSRVAIEARGAPATCGSLGVPVPRISCCDGGHRHDVTPPKVSHPGRETLRPRRREHSPGSGRQRAADAQAPPSGDKEGACSRGHRTSRGIKARPRIGPAPTGREYPRARKSRAVRSISDRHATPDDAASLAAGESQDATRRERAGPASVIPRVRCRARAGDRNRGKALARRQRSTRSRRRQGDRATRRDGTRKAIVRPATSALVEIRAERESAGPSSLPAISGLGSGLRRSPLRSHGFGSRLGTFGAVRARSGTGGRASTAVPAETSNIYYLKLRILFRHGGRRVNASQSVSVPGRGTTAKPASGSFSRLRCGAHALGMLAEHFAVDRRERPWALPSRDYGRLTDDGLGYAG